MELYAKLYYFYRLPLIRLGRFFFMSILLVLVGSLLTNHLSPKIPLFLFNLLVICELFFHYKVSRMKPSLPAEKNKGKHIFDSFTLPAVYGFVTQTKTSALIKKLIEEPQVKMVMEKANISHKDIVFTDLPMDMIAKSAFETTQTFKGTYVTTIDVFVSYLFLTEKDTKLLFTKQLKFEDLYNIVYWARQMHPEEETPERARVHFYGAGIGESFVSGWTPETKKYTSLFTSYALNHEPLISGRQAEFKQMLEGLIKVEANNILLVGDIGAGKENLVKALAYHSFEGNLGGYLNYKRIFQLLVGAFTAGATSRGDLEVRLQNIISEVSHSGDVMLYVPDFQNILGASSYGLDLSGALLPYLSGGNLPVIASMSTGNFKTFMEKNPIKEVFTIIHLKEPDKDTAIHMVLAETQNIEKKYHVSISYAAVSTAVELSERFFQDEVLPGSAVALLETVANKVAIDTARPYYEHTHRRTVLKEDMVKKVEETSHVALSNPTGEEIQLLLHLEDKLHERVIEQSEAISAIAEAMRRVRAGMLTSERPISFLFLGPTGVGKTETAKALADLYYGGEKNMIRLDMSEYTDEDGVKRLLGAPPGQGSERGELTDKIHDNPASLVLLDEFEKANPKIHNLFLQVLDDGRLTDNKGQTVSFRNAIIIATSNAGSEFIREAVEKGTKIDKDFQKKLLDFLQSKALFKPELLNRFDDVITFKPLGGDQVKQVVKLLLKSLTKTLADQDITVTFDNAVVEKIAQEGFDQEFGARPLRRYIQDTIEDFIAQRKLTNEITRGKKVNFFINGTGALDLSVS